MSMAVPDDLTNPATGWQRINLPVEKCLTGFQPSSQ
jgi:hypothetical protein